jgi:hypothetical protein
MMLASGTVSIETSPAENNTVASILQDLSVGIASNDQNLWMTGKEYLPG